MLFSDFVGHFLWRLRKGMFKHLDVTTGKEKREKITGKPDPPPKKKVI